MSKKGQKREANSIQCSQAVTHPSTDWTQRCLTSVIGRELVYSTWYGRWHLKVTNSEFFNHFSLGAVVDKSWKKIESWGQFSTSSSPFCSDVRGWKSVNLWLSNANGHITLNTPVLVRSLKLSNVESSQYLDGWPPGNTGCCWLLTFYSFLANFSVKESLSKFLEPLVILLVSCNLLPKRILKTKKIGFPDHFENSWKFLWGEKSRFLSQFFCAQKTWFFAS